MTRPGMLHSVRMWGRVGRGSQNENLQQDQLRPRFHANTLLHCPPGPDNILGTRRAHARRPPQATLQGQIRRPKMRPIFRAFGPESGPWAHFLVQFGGPRLVPSSRPRRKKKAAPLGLFRSPHKGIRQDAQRQCQSGPRWSTRPGMASGSSRGSGGSGASASSEVLEALEALEALKALEALEALESLEPLLGPTVNFASA